MTGINEKISFELISKAGSAFSLLISILDEAKKQNFEQVDEKLREAENLMNEAHNIQTSLIVSEANGKGSSVNVLLIHAQDTLMNTILMFTLVKEFLYIYKNEGEKKNG